MNYKSPNNILFACCATLLLCFNLSAQCTNGAAFGSAAAPTNATPVTISSCTYQSEYNTITGVAAATTYTSTNSAGGCITVHRGTPGGPVVGFGPSPLSWTSTTAGTYYIHYNTNCSCGTATGCTTTTITCTSCSAGSNPCTSPASLSCGTPVTANMSGTGAGWNITNCGYSTPGDEMIYSFTATTTGTYSLNITSQSGGYIDYFWANAAGGCSAGATWNCIDDIFSAGTYGAMNWVAGTTYYILLDPEGTGAYSSTFSVNCPSASTGPCATITPLIGCGTSTTASMSGAGAGWNPGSCGFSTPGTEMIFSFTATASGVHAIDVTSASGGFVDFFWLDASFGCSSGAAWNCIDDILSPGTYGSMNWVAGNTYYILLDPEGTGSYSVTFNVDCPNPGTPTVAGDCNVAIPVCTNLGFQVDPSGYGLVDELCTSCTSNPGTNPADPANWGCLLSGELNSTWFTVNVAASGTLEFSFGSPGALGDCFDWIMWPYNPTACTNILGNSLAPTTCNWNSPCDGFTGVASTPPAGGYDLNFQPTMNVTAGQQFVICFSNYSSAVTSVPLNFFGTADISCTLLPVELSAFAGQDMGAYNELFWSTASEVNNSHFDVQRSLDGINYTTLATIDGAGTSLQPNDYRTIDPSPGDQVTYYRLKQVDYNGAYKYSEIIAISQEDNTTFAVLSAYPNPTKELFNIDLMVPQDGLVDLVIRETEGKVVRTITVDTHVGVNHFEIPVGSLSSGLYFVSILNPNSQKTEVIKLTIN